MLVIKFEMGSYLLFLVLRVITNTKLPRYSVLLSLRFIITNDMKDFLTFAIDILFFKNHLVKGQLKYLAELRVHKMHLVKYTYEYSPQRTKYMKLHSPQGLNTL